MLPDVPAAPVAAPGPAAPTPAPDGAPGRFDDEARAVIERALAHAGGRIHGAGGAAALLGLRPTALQGKMRRYGIRAPRER